MQVHADGLPVGYDRRQVAAGRLAGERDDGLHLRVVGEGLRHRQVDRGTRCVRRERALVHVCEARRDRMRVPDQEVGRIDQHRAVALPDGLETPDHRARKRLVDRRLLERIVAGRSIAEIVFDQQHLRPRTLERNDLCRSQLPAVETDIVGADAARHRRLVQEFLVEIVDLDDQPALAIVPVEVVEARQMLVTAESCNNVVAAAGRRLPTSGEDGYGDNKKNTSQHDGSSGSIT